MKSIVANKNTNRIYQLDTDLVARLIEGDHQSFETIFHLFYYRVGNFLFSLTKNRDLAEELAQQVFVNLWENRNKLDSGKNINSYLFTMAKNAALGHFRNVSLHREIEKQVLLDEPIDNMENDLITREAFSVVDTVVSHMPRKRRKVYELSQVQNKSNNEIADELKITKKAVEKHLRIALSDIRTQLEKFIY